jgi:hypothetical protein
VLPRLSFRGTGKKLVIVNNRRILMAARGVALVISVVMIYYFATAGVIRSDNPFLVPDALLTVFLLTAALLPRRLAAPGLIFAFGWDTAVYTTSLCTYAVRGEFAEGTDHIALILPSLAMALLLIQGVSKCRTRRPG